MHQKSQVVPPYEIHLLTPPYSVYMHAYIISTKEYIKMLGVSGFTEFSAS